MSIALECFASFFVATMCFGEIPVDSKTNKIVIYAFAGGTWWVQPTVDSPLTDIDDQGVWQTVTHLGSTYAVLLVNSSYKAPATMSGVPKVSRDVLAVKLVQGKP